MKVKKITVSNKKDHFFDIMVPDVHEYILDNNVVSHNSSLASGTTNSVYPIRELTLIKTDNNNTSYWAAPEGDKLEKYYDIAWNLPTGDLIDMYAIVQKFTDQAISADLYKKIAPGDTVTTKEMISDFLYRVKMGMKTRYYMNSKTSSGITVSQSSTESDIIQYNSNSDDDDDCEACKL